MNRFRYVAITASLLGLLGCQTLHPIALDPTANQAIPHELGKGTVSISVRWPSRTIQLIPLSTQTIWLQVKQSDGTVIQECQLSRPDESGGVLVAQTTLPLAAGTGYTVQADAFRDAPASSDSVSIASAVSAPFAVVANQRTPVTLSLGNYFTPTLASFSPSNGGPGVPVTLLGTFGDSGYYGMSIGGAKLNASGATDSITANVPDTAVTGAVIAWADGASASLTSTFSVLETIAVSPTTRTTTVASTVSFSVPSAQDTGGLTVNNPTITAWDVVDPADGSTLSSVGTMDGSGVFTAATTGTAWVRAWSGTLAATAAVTVN